MKTITVTYTGTLINFLPILPVCSSIYKQLNKKFLFILDEKDQIINDVLKLQPFTEDVIFYNTSNLVKFDPRVTELNNIYDFSDIYMFTDIWLSNINTNITSYYETELLTTSDKDFVLNLDLHFKYHAEEIATIEALSYAFPYYTTYNESILLDTLQQLAYSQERHLSHSYISVLLAYAGIPFYLYITENNAFSIYWAYYGKLPILDIRQINNSKIKSIYNTIYFV